MTASIPSLRRSPLHEAHVRCGGRLIEFAGWELPVQFDGALAEHRHVRSAAGIFDVSHMGQVFVHGVDARDDLQRLLSNDIDRLAQDGMAQYTLLTNGHGGIEDDLIVYRLRADRYLLVVNAANRVADVQWMLDRTSAGTVVDDLSDAYAMIAIQGPRARESAVRCSGLSVVSGQLDALQRFTFAADGDERPELFVACTGYTGEDGFEVIIDRDGAESLWDEFVADALIKPCGLAARDTLRLEACYPLHGSDITRDTSALEAGLGWACSLDTSFTGADALEREREAGVRRRLVALRADGRGIPRSGHEVRAADGRVVGHVTSGTMSPTLGVGIALAYVESGLHVPGTHLVVDVRGRPLEVTVQRKPLYPPHEELS